VSAATPGPLAEEAARLVEAISEWARGAAGGVSMPAADAGPECGICPFCQLLALVGRTQPETFGHLADASASMVAALRTIVERHDHAGGRTTGVERIDLDDREPSGEQPAGAADEPGPGHSAAGAAT
jgi:Family of unknown function (DUF5304)